MDTESFVHLTVPLVKEVAASMHYLDPKDAGCNSTYSVLYFVLKGLVCRSVETLIIERALYLHAWQR